MRRIAAAVAGLVIAAGAARGQSIEPRSYSPAPTGVNFLVVGEQVSHGGVALDPSVPLVDPRLTLTGPVLAYARTFGLFGRSAKIDVIAPLATVSGTAVYNGEPVGRTVTGLADPRARLSVNLIGGPALGLAEFRRFRPGTILGASVQVTAPLGQYDPSHLVNLGAHRWSVKPELGLSKSAGRWSFELQTGATFYGANDDFFGGHRRTQDPLYSVQLHTIYSFRSGAWAALDGTWYGGGRSTLDGVLNNDLQSNWRIGTTLAFPVTARHSIKLTASHGVLARTGGNFDLLGVAWQYRWGGGI
jgi:hypothetical protein